MEESFDILVIFQFLLKHKYLIATISILCCIATFVISSTLIPKKYTSSVQLYVENKSTTTESLSSSDISVAQQLVDTCSIIFTSSSVFDKLSEDTNIPYSADELSGMVKVGAVNNTEIMKITVESNKAAHSQYIANALCDICMSEYARVISTGSITAIDEPKKSSSPSFPNNKKFALLGFVAGFVISCAFIILRNILDTRVKPDDNLAEIYDIPVFAEIMDFENKSGLAHAYRYDTKGN